jgi:ABC-type glycerol-3-phosphate transport system permease component
LFNSKAGESMKYRAFKYEQILILFLLGTFLITIISYQIILHLNINAYPIYLVFLLNILFVSGLLTSCGVFFAGRYIDFTASEELMEAAKIEGCSKIMILWYITLPLLTHIIVIQVVATSIFAWFYYSRLVSMGLMCLMMDRSGFTQPIVLRSLAKESPPEEWSISLNTILMTIPLVLVFIFVSKNLITHVFAKR